MFPIHIRGRQQHLLLQRTDHLARIRDEDFDFQTDGGDFESIAGASDSMAIDDALHGSQRHDMRMQIHDQDMADAKAKNQRDVIAMVENRHQKIHSMTVEPH